MTREEAIQRLKNIDIREALQEDYDAIDMAIEALYHHTEKTDNISTKVKSDLISRADAICEVLVNDGIDNIVDRINALPSADRPQGEWIEDEQFGTFICTNCGAHGAYSYNYCPNCGARMEATK